MRTYVFPLVILGVLFSPFFSPNAFGWDNSYHANMVKDAIALCPRDLKEFLKNNYEDVIKGALEPDTVIISPATYAYNYRKHYYIPEKDKGSAPAEVKEIALSTIDLIVEGISQRALVAFRMGVISHYVADGIEPKRMIGKAPNYLGKFSIVGTYLTVNYDGYNTVFDYEQDLKNIASGTWNRDLTDDEYYDIAVNTIVDYWMSVWSEGGMTLGEMVTAGSRIRPAPEEKAETGPVTTKELSELFNLEKIGDTEVYNDKTFDLEKHLKDKGIDTSPTLDSETGSAETGGKPGEGEVEISPEETGAGEGETPETELPVVEEESAPETPSEKEGIYESQ